MRDHERELERAGARIAAIGLGGKTYAAQFRDETGIRFPLLVDRERTAYRTIGLGSASLLHLLRLDNHRARKRAKAGGHQQHRLGQNAFQLGGSFVFAPGNLDLYAHLSATFGDNAPLADLLDAVSAPVR